MVNIDTVYQKVLAMTNKEQRGYITPQEFNLLADKAQLEIFDSYFHDFKMLDMKPKTNSVKSDDTEFTEEKLAPFQANLPFTLISGTQSFSLPTDLYRLNTIHTYAAVGDYSGINVVEPMNKQEIFYTEAHPLTKATKKRRVYTRESNNNALIYPTDTEDINGVINYFRTPTTPKWGYVVVKGKALYNNNTVYTTHFELHPSEEEVLVSKITALSGLAIMKPEIIQAGGGMEAAIKQSQND